MTREQLNELYEKVKLEEEEKLISDKKLYQKGERNASKYNKSSIFLEKKSTDRLDYIDDLDEIIEHLCEYRELINKLKNEIGFMVSLYFDFDEGYINKNEFVAYYYVLKEEVSDITIKNRFKEVVSKMLKPSNVDRANTVDCKMLELFKDGNIDWLTLQKLTYTNCGL